MRALFILILVVFLYLLNCRRFKLNILVTGSSGYIGMNLVRVLEKLGHKVTQYDIKLGSNQDIAHIEYLCSVLQQDEIEAVYHLAAKRNVVWCEKNPIECESVNLAQATALYELCNSIDIQFIFASTTCVNGLLNNYAKSKLKAERAMPKATIVRLTNVVGLMGEGQPLVDYPSLTDNIIYCIRNNCDLNLYGDTVRNFVYLGDVVKSFVMALNRPAVLMQCIGGVNLNISAYVGHFERFYQAHLRKNYYKQRQYESSDLSHSEDYDRDYLGKIIQSYAICLNKHNVQLNNYK